MILDKESIQSMLSNTFEPEMLHGFLTHIFRDLQKKCGKDELSFFSFQEFFGMPMIISEKVFNCINTSLSGVLSQREFEDGLYLLYSGTIEDKFRLAFQIFDFNHDEVICIEDIICLLSHCHMMDQTSETVSLLEEIIEHSVAHLRELTYEEFFSHTYKTNADIFFLLLTFFEKYKPFTEYQINTFSKTQSEHVFAKKKYSNQNNYFKCFQLSNEFIDYVNSLYCGDNEENKNIENELKELDLFEDNFEEIISVYSGTKTAETSDECHNDKKVSENVNVNANGNGNGNDVHDHSKLFNFFTKKRFTFVSTNTEMSPVISKKTLEQRPSRKRFSLDQEKKSSIDFDENEITLFALKKNKFIKCKLSLVDDLLFFYIFNTVTDDTQFKSVITLKSTFPQECYQITYDDQVYYPFQLVSYYEMNKEVETFLSTDHKSVTSFISRLKRAVNYRRIEDYFSIEHELGKGQFGQVRLGINKMTGEKVAIKYVSKIGANKDEKDYINLKREIDIFKFLHHASHPGIIKPIDIFDCKEHVLFVFEYIDGGDLKSFVINQRRLLSPEEITYWSTQILCAVGFLHKYGIIHRDLKPANILLDGKGSIKIIDFGFSKVIGRKETAYEMLGSLCYTAPEIIQNKAYDHRVDVWSIGVIIYYLTFGTHPFVRSDKDTTLKKLEKRIIYDSIPFPVQKLYLMKDDNYENIFSKIKKCLVKHRESRPNIEHLLV